MREFLIFIGCVIVGVAGACGFAAIRQAENASVPDQPAPTVINCSYEGCVDQDGNPAEGYTVTQGENGSYSINGNDGEEVYTEDDSNSGDFYVNTNGKPGIGVGGGVVINSDGTTGIDMGGGVTYNTDGSIGFGY